MSRTAKRHLSFATVGLVLVVTLIAFAFTPPSAVPYSGADYLERAKLKNATGMTQFATYESPGACPLKVNLFSQNAVYSLPILSFPGRAGLGMSLSLVYNSKVWVKSGSTIFFDGDKGWPAPGWRLGFGRIDGKYTISSVDHYFLISGDGSVRDLKYNATSGKYESFDSSYIDFDDSTGILRHKDGTQVTYAAQSSGYVMPTQIKDRNGNYITINYTGTGQQISSIVDTLGRSTSFTYDGNGNLSTISRLGFGGASRTWTFAYQDTQLSYTFNALTVNGPSSGAYVKTLVSVTYPNSTKQVFLYNGYAQMYEAQLQSSSSSVRGKYLVTWQSTPGGGWTDSPTPASVGNNDGSSTNTYSLSFSSYSTTFTNPASTPRTTTFINSGAWDDALPSQTTVGSTTVRTFGNVWGHDGNSVNPRLTRTTTALNDSTEQSKVEYDYTSYGNVSEVREYAWDATGLKRKTGTTYVTDSNYTSRHILSLPASVSIYNESNVRKSYTTFAYEGASLASAAGGFNHDDANYGTSFMYRGLRTSVTRYTDGTTPAGPITDNYTYDMVGNLRTESADCCVTKTHNYSMNTYYSYPESVVRGSVTTLTTSSVWDYQTGLPSSSTDENSKQTTYSYDVADRLTTTTRSDGTQFTTGFDDTSATASSTTTSPITATTSIKQKSEVDGLGRSIRATVMDSGSNVISKADTLYNSIGAVWKTSLPYTGASASYWTENVYDQLGRVTKVIPPDGTASTNHILTQYVGRITTVTDQAGKQRASHTDPLGRVTQVQEPAGNPPSLATPFSTYYSYDPMGNVTQICHNNCAQPRTFAFDGLSRKTSETTPEGGTVSYAYNSDSLLTSRTDARGVVTTYTYDSSLNRLTSVSYNVSCCTSTVPATSTVSYTYGASAASNNNGRLVTMTDGLGQEDYTYDSLGRSTQVAKKIYNVVYSTSYTYNLAGEVVNMTYPSGRVVKHEYDAIGRVAGVKNNTTSANYASSAGYNATSQLTGFTYGNGVGASFGYSSTRLQLSSVAYTQGGGNLFSLSYGYAQSGNNSGKISTITDNIDGGRTTTFTYDARLRLATAGTSGSSGYPQWGLSWTYDDYGNRTAQSVTAGSGPSNSVSVSTSTNQITGMGTYTFYYDSSGNLTQDDLYKFKYDAEHRLVETRDLSNNLIGTYAYDGNSLRTIKVWFSDRTWYIHAGSQLVSEFYDAASATYSNPTYPGGAGSDSTATLLYQHADYQTTRLTTDQQGQVSNEQGHYPYGEQWYAGGGADASVERKFTSYLRDEEVATGKMNFAGGREHSGRTGRFIVPLRGAAGTNGYSFSQNDPVSTDAERSGEEAPVVPLGQTPAGLESLVAWKLLNFWSGLNLVIANGGIGNGGLFFPTRSSGTGRGFTFSVMFGGGISGSCNGQLGFLPSLLGMGCGGPPITPPQPNPQCFAQLKSRGGLPGLVGKTHTFWYVGDRSGSRYVISGEKEGSFLNVCVTVGERSHCNADSASNRTEWPRSPGAPVSCDSVDRMIIAALDFQRNYNNSVTYSIRGPNSNSVASCMSFIGGIYPTYPESALGWGERVPAGPCSIARP